MPSPSVQKVLAAKNHLESLILKEDENKQGVKQTLLAFLIISCSFGETFDLVLVVRSAGSVWP